MGSTNKRERLLELLNTGKVMIHLDARREGVIVPAEYRDQAHLRLNLSRRFEQPVEVGITHVRATLSFGGVRFACSLPWNAIFGMTSDSNAEPDIWFDDLPEEVLEKVARDPRAHLRPLPMESTSETVAPASSPPERSTKRAHLRLVK